MSFISDGLQVFDFADIIERKSKAFGIFPVHKEPGIDNEPILDDLPDPFYALDFRDWQIVNVNQSKLVEIGASVILREKIRPHVDLERAVMGVRFSEDWVGVQFHPEADPQGIASYFSEDEKKASVIETYGVDKYNGIIDGLNDPNKIPLTYATIIPNFLDTSLGKLKGETTLI